MIPPPDDKPPRPIRPSAIDRHQLNLVKHNTWVQQKISLALPGIDVAGEIERINPGHGQLVGDSRYEINGRVHVVKPEGAAYPESGEGIVSVSRPVFLVLRQLIEHGGRTDAFNRAFERDPTYSEEVIREALGLFELRKGQSRCT